MNHIHPTSIIGNNVKLGDNNFIGPFCYITGDTIIGNNNRFEAYCSVGTPPEHKDYFTITNQKTQIGNNNTFREFTTIHSGTTRTTTIHDDIIVLNHSHIAHDVIIEKNSTISANVILAGHCYLMEGVNLGVGSMCHQFSKIGAYSMLGMGAVVTSSSKINPGGIYIGIPAKYLKNNIVGLERNNVNLDKLNHFKKIYEKI
jgi:UDP-N-acetylglucosamine acyltransferase